MTVSWSVSLGQCDTDITGEVSLLERSGPRQKDTVQDLCLLEGLELAWAWGGRWAGP